ncbi:MAG TPA: pitrilysin family protein [Gemmatimonadaceae bacterium]|nr:pitrilysin family protein [Gemmatimonadaceae bacterium]
MSARTAILAVSTLLVAATAACASHPAATPSPAPAAVEAPVPAAQPKAVDITKPPELAPPPTLDLPPIVTRKLGNGLSLMIVEQHELPVADFIMLVHTGGEADPSRLGGLASLTADMLDEGTRTRNALQIADQIAFLGADLSTSSGWDRSVVSLHTTTAQMDSALALFADVVLKPAFPEADLARVRKERLTSLLQLEDYGPAIADRVFDRVVFGDRNPYGHPISGTRESVTGIARSDLSSFYSKYYRANNATLIVVGDVKPDDVERRAQSLFGSWERGEIPATQYGPARPSRGRTIYLVDKPGAAQSSFRIGGVGVARSTPDYFAIEVMNTILGGSFTSRLNQNLRETHGYTYGAFSSFAMRRQPGPFTAEAEIVAAKTDSALLQFMAELRGIRDSVPDSELTKTKQLLQLQLPGDFETTRSIASRLVPVAIYDLPLDFYNQYVGRIGAVTQSDVQRVAREEIKPDSFDIVIVGDGKVVEPALNALSIAPLKRLTVQGDPVQP